MYYSSYFDRNPDVLPDLALAIERQNEKTGELTEQLKRLCNILEKGNQSETQKKGDKKDVLQQLL